ncbi:hypothetical protein O181_124926 [Austropuccinia psidii MF-1]|uniref:Uncharacterized protein n=1 Tax=Austropuccinia psidii MF-1 TaxID=1389203 RepID=A0A9Q3KRD1_9BASI|nr:hypothetical protein [Austropuccinia psidii MF-1]
MWKSKLTSIISGFGLISTWSDESLFLNTEKSLPIYVHVNNGFIISYMLKWSADKILINQTDLFTRLLQQFNMDECKPVKTPCSGNFLNELESGTSGQVFDAILFQQAIGSINYLAHHTWPDILFTINQLSQYSTKPHPCHWNGLQHLSRYLKGSKDKSLIYNRCTTKDILIIWADADYANVKDDRKSITGYVILAFGNPVFWLSKKESVVAQSTTEAEYITMNICMKQLQWITLFLKTWVMEIFNPYYTTTIQELLQSQSKHC